MAATWESVGVDPTTSTSDTVMNVPKPTGLAVGDLMVAFGACVEVRTISAPAGWSVQADSVDSGARVYVWTKVADSGDTAASTFTFTVSGGGYNSAEVAVHRVSGASSNTPTMGFGTGDRKSVV